MKKLLGLRFLRVWVVLGLNRAFLVGTLSFWVIIRQHLLVLGQYIYITLYIHLI